MKVWWAYLAERSIQQDGVSSLTNVAMHAGGHGYTRIMAGYMRTDTARNKIVTRFLKESTDPDDVVVMLDNDHIHPADTIERLVADNKPVVASLAFMRGEPFSPCAFVRGDDGRLHPIADWGAGLYPVTTVGHPAIAIKRSVFQELERKGYKFPYWRYIYTERKMLFESGAYRGDDMLESFPSEDMYFGKCCEDAGITHWIDTRIIAPHLITSVVDDKTFSDYRADHPELQETMKVTVNG